MRLVRILGVEPRELAGRNVGAVEFVREIAGERGVLVVDGQRGALVMTVFSSSQYIGLRSITTFSPRICSFST